MSTKAKRRRSSSINAVAKVAKHREEVKIPFLYPVFDATSPDTSYFPNIKTVTERVAEEHLDSFNSFLIHVVRHDTIESVAKQAMELVCLIRRLCVDKGTPPLSYLDIATAYSEIATVPFVTSFTEDRDRVAACAKQFDASWSNHLSDVLADEAIGRINAICKLLKQRVPAHLVWCQIPSGEHACMDCNFTMVDNGQSCDALVRDLLELQQRLLTHRPVTTGDVAWLDVFASYARVASFSRSFSPPDQVRDVLEIVVGDVVTYKSIDTIKKGRVISINPCLDLCTVEPVPPAETRSPDRVAFHKMLSKDKAVVVG